MAFRLMSFQVRNIVGWTLSHLRHAADQSLIIRRLRWLDAIAPAPLATALFRWKREVAGQIPPHRMDVVGLVLGVVVFDHERRTLNSVMVRLAEVRLAVPCRKYILSSPADVNAFRVRSALHIVWEGSSSTHSITRGSTFS